MPIRFQCASCSQPIEVDDDLATRVVACPYCRKTVTAPSQSTLLESTEFPVASPLGTPGRPAYGYRPAGYSGTNVLAVVALALSSGALVLYFASGTIAANHRVELEEIYRHVAEQGGGMAAQFEAMNKLAAERGGTFPTWLYVMGLLYLGSLGTWVAAVICGLIAVRREPRRGLAVGALGLCLFYTILSCSGAWLRP